MHSDELLNHLRANHPEFDEYAENLPDGWLPLRMCRILFNLARAINGPILEIGSFVGRSTACLAWGVKNNPNDVNFITTDLHFNSESAFLNHYRPIHGSDTFVPPKQLNYINNGGTLETLKANLAMRDLSSQVTILAGDFAEVTPPLDYRLVFCDATHDLNEIDKNVPRLLPFISSGTVIVLDDVSNRAMRAAVTSHIPFSYHRTLYRRLFVGIVDSSV